MGMWDRVRAALSLRPALVPTETFAVDTTSIDPSLFGMTSWDTTGLYAVPTRVTRAQAMSVPAVKRARDLIAGTLAGLPVFTLDADNRRGARPLFDQPEQDRARSITMANTFEDLLFEGLAFWRITAFDWTGYPQSVVRLDPRTVDVRENSRVYVRRDGSQQGVADEHIPDDQLIVFRSPHDGILRAGARAIRTCLALDATAAQYAETPQPQLYFTPREGAAEPTVEDVTDLIAGWKAARQAGSIGYMNGVLEPKQLDAWSPADLQLSDARQHAALEIARLVGIDPEDLGVSTTSRTYANSADRRLALQSDVLAPYATAVAERLSMGDVTPRGTKVRFDFEMFTRSSAADRIATYQAGLDLGIWTVADVAAREELPKPPRPKPAPAPAVPAPAPAPQQEEQVQQVQQHADPVTFAREDGITFDAAPESFRVDPHARTVTGLVVPYGPVAAKGGRKFRFAKGSLKYADARRVKLLLDHDATKPLGVLTKATETDKGMLATFKVARGADGDRALELAEDGVLDGLSVGVDFHDDGVQLDDDGVMNVSAAAWRETSLTALPAYDDARVSGVTASSDGGLMPCATCGQMHPAGTPCASPVPAVPAPAPAPADFSALAERLTAVEQGFAALPAARTVVPVGQLATVVEEAPYRFGGAPGAHDFSTDLFAGLRGDGEARERAERFAVDAMSERFAVTTANVDEVNPTRERPDMYVDRINETRRPVYDALYKGTVQDGTPFRFPGFDSASGLVADHVQGTEPTPGSFATKVVNTITPKAKSGKIELNREVIDAGGNPQVSTLIWREMNRAWEEALETEAVALLTGLTLYTAKTVTTAAADDVLARAVERIISDLEFQTGGARQDVFLTHANLHNSLIAASDSTGRRIYPMVGATNANGGTSARFRSVDVGGFLARPAWSLGAASTNVGYSWLLATEDLHVWASSPRRFDFEYQVKSVDMALWGWVATGWSRQSSAIRVAYDPTV